MGNAQHYFLPTIGSAPMWHPTPATNAAHAAQPPPYSPELNPMENIWDYLRGNKLSRLVWDIYEAMVATCKNA
jgi:hypothetical protein